MGLGENKNKTLLAQRNESKKMSPPRLHAADEIMHNKK